MKRKLLHELQDTLDELASDSSINEHAYTQLSKKMKDLNEAREDRITIMLRSIIKERVVDDPFVLRFFVDHKDFDINSVFITAVVRRRAACALAQDARVAETGRKDFGRWIRDLLDVFVPDNWRETDFPMDLVRINLHLLLGAKMLPTAEQYMRDYPFWERVCDWLNKVGLEPVDVFPCIAGCVCCDSTERRIGPNERDILRLEPNFIKWILRGRSIEMHIFKPWEKSLIEFSKLVIAKPRNAMDIVQNDLNDMLTRPTSGAEEEPAADTTEEP